MRIHPNIDGPNNTAVMTDVVPSDAPVGSPENYYGNAFYAKRTKFTTTGQSMTDYNGATSRTWDMCNENKLHPYSKKPASYKLVSREVPNLLPKEGSLVWKRAGFARHAVHVTKCESSCHHSPLEHLQRKKADTHPPPHQTLTTSSGPPAGTSPRRRASPRPGCRSGSATGRTPSRTRTSCCGTRSA